MVEALNAETKRSIKTIVFADDDRFFLEAITEFLASNGYTVHPAQEGLEALQLIRQVKPDCVILDIVLPKLDGGRFPAWFAGMPVCLLSSVSYSWSDASCEPSSKSSRRVPWF